MFRIESIKLSSLYGIHCVAQCLNGEGYEYRLSLKTNRATYTRRGSSPMASRICSATLIPGSIFNMKWQSCWEVAVPQRHLTTRIGFLPYEIEDPLRQTDR
jgi:hypothetical protein